MVSGLLRRSLLESAKLLSEARDGFVRPGFHRFPSPFPTPAGSTTLPTACVPTSCDTHRRPESIELSVYRRTKWSFHS